MRSSRGVTSMRAAGERDGGGGGGEARQAPARAEATSRPLSPTSWLWSALACHPPTNRISPPWIQQLLRAQLWPCLPQHVLSPQIGLPPHALAGRPRQTLSVIHEPCAAASGATIDSITGRRSEIPAARRRVRSIFRREYWVLSAGSVTGSLSKCALPKRSSAIHTTASSAGAADCSSSSAATSATFVCPSQCRQTRAAVRFRQWAL